MSHSYHKKPESEREDQPKDRRCLACGDMFPSTWSGERVCRRCKSKAVWRSGEDWTTGGRAA